MKEIDWWLVSSDTTLKQSFCLEVRNRFNILSGPDDDIEERYNLLVKSTEDVALCILPKKVRTIEAPLSFKDLVKGARKDLQKAKKRYEVIPTRSALKNTTEAQKRLDDSYLNAEAAFIQGKINTISCLHTSKQHASA